VRTWSRRVGLRSLADDDMNGDAGWRPALAAIGWFFVLDALDYGARLGSAPGVVGHICSSALLVRLLLALTPRCPFRSRE
jgi:hypothetical protein